VFTVGVGWLSRIPTNGSYLSDVLGPSLVIGVGLALSFVALTIASVSGIEAEHSGVAGGLINMTQQIGGAIGLAIITAVIASHVHGASPSPAALDGAFRAALTAAGLIGVAGLATAAVVLPRRSQPASMPGNTATAIPAAVPVAVPTA
jgi:hypothetical protein